MISRVLTYCDGDVEQVQFLLIEKIQDMHKQFLEESQLNFSAVRFVKYKIHINLVNMNLVVRVISVYPIEVWWHIYASMN